jgi:glucosylceramidase
MPRRTLPCALGLLLLFGSHALADEGARPAALLTRIDDGDRLETGTPESALTLLKPVPVLVPPAPTAIPVRLDPDTRFQTVHGLGAAMTDASASLLVRLKARDPARYDQTMKRLFDPTHTQGAGLSVLRLPIGTSDFAATGHAATYCDTPSPNLAAAFSIAIDEPHVIPALKDALALNPQIKLLGSPWSPPAWMKTNGQLEGITPQEKAAGATNRLRPEMFDTYAEYFVRFVEAYRDHGLTIWGVTLQNEPQFDAARYPCLRMDEADQIRLVAALGPKLRARGLDTRIFIHDHNWVLHPNDRKPVGGDQKLDPLDSVTAILADPAAGPHIAGTAWHGYSGDDRQMAHVYDTLRQRFPDRDLLFTELSGWGRHRGPWWGDLAWGLARPWLGGFLHGQTMALEWNLALDDRFGPSLRDDSEGLGLATIAGLDAPDAHAPVTVTYQREFYAMAQVSRAARPGWTRIQATTDAQALDVLAFTAPDRSQCSLVVFNRSAEPRSIRVECGPMPPFGLDLPARSLATLTREISQP